MKKLLLISVLVFSFSSCDFVLKDRSDDKTEVKTDGKVELGTVTDEKGCVTSAGYKWSELRNQCVRPFEEGYRLNSIDELQGESIAKSAFVIFEDDGDRAELFLPDSSKSIMLKKGKADAYTNGPWKLHLKKGYKLQKGSELLFAGAEIQENQITGDEKPEPGQEP
ncbi:hypothetical protein HYN59_12795 [Flavobacterium album]|uniref:Lipoprotein n=1 Tax=Flavobacterium album TaxID=2175091 RepID=A0A2S1R051_9FLAO|nr:hypothetical protein [Flavobacterium album]AWH85929.1 hypothetical protein HYN59_12795 [Flavobacterium album]